MLSIVIYDFGQMPRATFFLAHTGAARGSSTNPSQPQRLFRSNPDFRQTSHFQPDWFAN